MLAVVVVVSLLASAATALENGLARTPPMGWLFWERFACRTDCALFPDSCVSSANLIAQMDRLKADGFAALGYTQVNIDDCWDLHGRDAAGNLVPDPVRFPEGIGFLADYAHSRGLQLGIYGDVGSLTCGGYPGSHDFLEQDARLFAKWGVDGLKLDGCYCDTKEFPKLYPQMSAFLNATGRPILYSCSWPAYIQSTITAADFLNIAKHCNLWRSTWDINDGWSSITTILEWWAQHQDMQGPAQAPGAIADPDMLIIGNFGLSPAQSAAQMSLWCVMGAPLYMSNDLRKLDGWAKEILQNVEAIAVDQDALALPGRRVKYDDHFQHWTKLLSDGSSALAILNEFGFSDERRVVTVLSEIGLKKTNAVRVRDLWAHKELGIKLGAFGSLVAPTSAVMYKLTPVSAKCAANASLINAGDHAALVGCAAASSAVQKWTFAADSTIRLASNTKMCLRVGFDAAAENGAPALELSSCATPPENAQLFSYDSSSQTLFNKINGNCIAVAAGSTAEWAGVAEEECASTAKQQTWTLRSDGTILDNLGGRCLSVCSLVVA